MRVRVASIALLAGLTSVGCSVLFETSGDIGCEIGEQFAAAFQSPGADRPGGMAIDERCDVYVCGTFTLPIDVGGKELLMPIGDSFDFFVAKYRANGTYVDARAFGGSGVQRCQAIAAAPGGGVVIAGAYETKFALDKPAADQGGIDVDTPLGLGDLFVARLSDDLSPVWIHNVGADMVRDFGATLTVEPVEPHRIAVAGGFEPGGVFGGGIIAPGSGFVSVLAASGELQWQTAIGRFSAGGASPSVPRAVRGLAADERFLYAVGSFSDVPLDHCVEADSSAPPAQATLVRLTWEAAEATGKGQCIDALAVGAGAGGTASAIDIRDGKAVVAAILEGAEGVTAAAVEAFDVSGGMSRVWMAAETIGGAQGEEAFTAVAIAGSRVKLFGTTTSAPLPAELGSGGHSDNGSATDMFAVQYDLATADRGPPEVYSGGGNQSVRAVYAGLGGRLLAFGSSEQPIDEFTTTPMLSGSSESAFLVCLDGEEFGPCATPEPAAAQARLR